MKKFQQELFKLDYVLRDELTGWAKGIFNG